MTDRGPLDGASPTLAVVLTVRFLPELALLAGVVTVALQATSGGWRWPAALAGPVVVATVWGLLLSPKASIPLAPAAKIVLEAVLFLGTGVALVGVGVVTPAAIGVAVWTAHRIALTVIRD